MKRKTVYNFNSVQLTFNQCVFNRIQYITKHNLYSTRLDNSTGNSALQFSLQFRRQFRFTIPLKIRTSNFAYNSALQIRLQFIFTIPLTIQLTIRLYNWPYNFGWPKWVKRSERPSSDSTVVHSGCLVPRPSLADVSRIGRSNGKGNPWQGQFLVALFGR